MFDTVCETKEDIEYYARKLQEKGARNVLISMAGDGAILITEDGASIQMGTPKGKVINSVGAGDSMVAGFVAGYLKSGSYEEALKTGTAAGQRHRIFRRTGIPGDVRRNAGAAVSLYVPATEPGT